MKAASYKTSKFVTVLEIRRKEAKTGAGHCRFGDNGKGKNVLSVYYVLLRLIFLSTQMTTIDVQPTLANRSRVVLQNSILQRLKIRNGCCARLARKTTSTKSKWRKYFSTSTVCVLRLYALWYMVCGILQAYRKKQSYKTIYLSQQHY